MWHHFKSSSTPAICVTQPVCDWFIFENTCDALESRFFGIVGHDTFVEARVPYLTLVK